MNNQYKIDFINNCVLEKDINKILNICEKGIGKSSVFMFDYPIFYKNKGYVYFLIKNKSIVYIGQSTQKTRIGYHKKEKDFDSFYYIWFEDNQHYHIETLLLKKFITKYNNCTISKKTRRENNSNNSFSNINLLVCCKRTKRKEAI